MGCEARQSAGDGPGGRHRGRIDHRQRLDDLKEKYDAAEAKLAELKAAGSSKWEVFQGGVETAWRELANAFTRLAN